MVSTVDRRQKPINYLIRKAKAFFADWTHSSCVTLNLIFIKCDHFCWGLFQQFKIRLLIVRNHLFASCRTIIIHIHFSSKFFEISLFSLKQKTIQFFCGILFLTLTLLIIIYITFCIKRYNQIEFSLFLENETWLPFSQTNSDELLSIR